MNEKLKDTAFKLFLLAIVEIFCLNLFIIISAITGSFDWPVERLISSFAGFLIQIINLVSLISGMLIAVYVIIVIVLLLKG